MFKILDFKISRDSKFHKISGGLYEISSGLWTLKDPLSSLQLRKVLYNISNLLKILKFLKIL